LRLPQELLVSWKPSFRRCEQAMLLPGSVIAAPGSDITLKSAGVPERIDW
jgi:hypothetical protein